MKKQYLTNYPSYDLIQDLESAFPRGDLWSDITLDIWQLDYNIIDANYTIRNINTTS